MGARSSRVVSTKWNFDHLAQATGLTRSEVEQFYSDYSEAAGRDGVMDGNEFIDLYRKLPIARLQDPNTIKDQATRIFRAFDVDHNGILSFDEFLSAIIMMNFDMSQNDRLYFLIENNNTSEYNQDDKRISKEYGYQILRRLNDYHGLPTGTEHQAWKEIDPDDHGYVTNEEFVSYINQHPIYKR